MPNLNFSLDVCIFQAAKSYLQISGDLEFEEQRTGSGVDIFTLRSRSSAMDITGRKQIMRRETGMHGIWKWKWRYYVHHLI